MKKILMLLGILMLFPMVFAGTLTTDAFDNLVYNSVGVCLVNGTTFTGAVAISSNLSVTGNISTTKYFGDGSTLTGIPTSALVSGVASNVSALQTSNTTTNSRIDSVNATVGALQTSNTTTNSRIDSVNATVGALQTSNTTTNGMISALQTSNTTTNSRIDSLNSTKANLASPTFTGTVTAPALAGDVAFDTDVLYVDSVNNRVGVGDSTPSAKLDISNSAAQQTLKVVQGDSSNWAMDVTTNKYGLQTAGTGSGGVALQVIPATGAKGIVVSNTGAANTVEITHSNAVGMGLYVGSGTARTDGSYYLLDIQDDSTTTTANTARIQRDSTTTGNTLGLYDASVGTTLYLDKNSNGSSVVIDSESLNSRVFTINTQNGLMGVTVDADNGQATVAGWLAAINANAISGNKERSVSLTNEGGNQAVYLLAGANGGPFGTTAHFYRNLNSTQTADGMVEIKQDHASDDQNVLDIVNDGTGSGLYLDQNGNGPSLYIDTASTSSGIYSYFTNTIAAGQGGHYLYSNVAQTNSPLLLVHSDAAGSTAPVTRFVNDGTGSALVLDQNGQGYALEVDSNATTKAPMRIVPMATAPSACSIGDMYVDTSGAYCACTASNTWSNMVATGTCA